MYFKMYSCDATLNFLQLTDADFVLKLNFLLPVM